VSSAIHFRKNKVQTSAPRLSPAASRRIKRFIDIGGSLVLIVVLSPLLVAIALLVYLTDGAPVIHRRRVVGPRGEFDAFKFRSMCRDADTMLDSDDALRQTFRENFKLRSDPRVTRLGRYLRKSSLDELPQLFNVLAGQMSLVGPRMITAPELDKYGVHKDLLLTVRPGLTGYWQVHGRQNVSYEERVRMDIDYIRRWNLGLDIELLLLTPLRVIRGGGAY
jgi:lipopolysaccharide/colanic/teichoic acid biosynthesis glycosyltransferase